MTTIYFAVDYTVVYANPENFKFDGEVICTYDLKNRKHGVDGAYAFYVITSSLQSTIEFITKYKVDLNVNRKYMFFEAKVSDELCANAIESLLCGNSMSKFSVDVINIYDENRNVIDHL